jgi:glutamate N-acetyltransferase/amino-acid N-acetyltransferase
MSGVTSPLGFMAAATACGIKPTGPDLAMIAADRCCSAAAVFTTNRAQAAPVVVSRGTSPLARRAPAGERRLRQRGDGRAGPARRARGWRPLAAEHLGCQPGEVVVASTGVIGLELPMERIRAGVRSRRPEPQPRQRRRGGARDPHHGHAPAEVVVEFLDGRTARVGAMAKGAGMIAPRMATYARLLRPTPLSPLPCSARSLREAVGASLNRITVDGDTSTNDMAVVLASGPFRRPPSSRKGTRCLPGRPGEAAQRIAAMFSETPRARRASPRCAWRARSELMPTASA